MNKLNLGCGHDYKNGWINLDINPNYCPEVVWNIEVFPYPFDDNEFDRILVSHVLEHTENPIKVLNELYRISKTNALIAIRVPHFSHYTSYGDLTHKHHFSSCILDQLKYEGNYYYGMQEGFKLISLKLNAIRIQNSLLRKLYAKLFNPIINLSPRLTDQFLSKFILVSEMTFIMKVVK